MRRLAPAALAALLWTAPAIAQRAGADDPLGRIEQLAAAGRFTEARAALEQWNRVHPESVPADAETRAHALLLGGRLAADAESARAAYLAVALGYPRTTHAAEALLRLGQGHLAASRTGAPAAEAGRAIPWLERLASEHPLAAQRSAGLLWLARAYSAAGRNADACLTARAAAGTSERDEKRAGMIENEERAACTDTQDRAVPIASRRTEPVPVPTAEPPPASHAFTVQVAAMRERPRADALARQLRADGFDVRVVSIEGSALVRVRVGRFATQAEAGEIARRVRAAGHDAIIVDDTRRETAR